jgi:cell division protein FtsB
MSARAATAILLALLVVLQYRLWFGPNAVTDVFAFEQRLSLVEADNTRLAQRNAVLHADVADLRRGHATIEERARTELGMIGDGETFYFLPGTP